MARLEEADEDFKLPLRPWLEKQINSGKFKGLEWEQCDGETKMFRLPWVKKNLPEWEEYYKIFRAWADHRGRGEADGLDDSKLKSNFRCALNKSADFVEVSSRSQLQRQTGNYKMYRILTPREVRERKKSRSKGKPKHEHNLNDDEVKTIDAHGLDVLDSLGSSSSCGASYTMDVDPSLNFATIDESVLTPTSSYLMSTGDLARDPITTIRPPDMPDFSPGLAISPAGPVVPATLPQDVSMEEEPSPAPIPSSSTEDDNVSLDLDPSSATALISEQLGNAGVDLTRLCECKVIVTYNGEKVLERVVEDLHKGYRIFYGNKDEQLMRLLQMRNRPEEKLADFQLQGIQLPTLVQPNHTMSAILNKTDLGVVIRYDPQTLRLCAKRLCQSQVFFFDPHVPSTSEPIKLEREQIVELFSYEKYVLQYIEQVVYEENLVPPEAEIVLSVGIKPKSKLNLPVMKGLKIELIPYALDFFAKNNSQHSSSISLCFSNPISLETLLRTIKQKSSPTKDSINA